MKKKFCIIIGMIVIISVAVFALQKSEINNAQAVDDIISKNENETVLNENPEEESMLPSQERIELQDVDGKGTNFIFIYNDETFNAIYSKDNWHIIDSYKIKNAKDIMIICKSLIDIHPIHGSDMVSFRSAEDLTYEWLQHNLAYEVLPESNSWREHAKDVDLNPGDQGKTLEEMYEIRTGKKLNIKDIYLSGK